MHVGAGLACLCDKCRRQTRQIDRCRRHAAFPCRAASESHPAASRQRRPSHCAASTAALLRAGAIVSGRWWQLAAAVVVGYGRAWTGHLVIERNRPATFGHPLWSLASDFRILALWVRFRLEPQRARAWAAQTPGGLR
ncbi:MAG: DUF962 domain-containing protein [Rhodospirillales bacterium]|nr:DUF962 domain-containing protein [Rhodospirillales bacterium]